MKKYSHIGWIKYCTRSTSMSKASGKKCEPWPCQVSFFKSKPELSFGESSEQFFWKKAYVKA